jgi:hypothetical protein
MSITFTIDGHKVRTSSPRRYIVVNIYNGRAHIIKRTDSIDAAAAAVRQFTTNDRPYVYDTRISAVVVADSRPEPEPKPRRHDHRWNDEGVCRICGADAFDLP